MRRYQKTPRILQNHQGRLCLSTHKQIIKVAKQIPEGLDPTFPCHVFFLIWKAQVGIPHSTNVIGHPGGHYYCIYSVKGGTVRHIPNSLRIMKHTPPLKSNILKLNKSHKMIEQENHLNHPPPRLWVQNLDFRPCCLLPVQ